MNPAQALYSVTELRAIEHAAMSSLPPHALMQRAGMAAAALAIELAKVPEARILAVAGPGNNGGDAIEAASRLCDAGQDVHVLLLAEPAALQGDAAAAYQRACNHGVPFHPATAAAGLFSQSWNLALDGMFGIGLARPITGAMRDAVESINRLECPVLALDIPSGLDADTGTVVGTDGVAVRASHTITFIGDKPGLHTGAARDHAGPVTLASLDIAPSLFPSPRARCNAVASFAQFLNPRRHDSHKGSFGDVIVLGGAHGMTGAPVLGARAAVHCGAGRVFIGFIEPGLLADSGQPELMCRDAQTLDFSHGVVVAGPGMGESREALDQLARALGASTPLLADADALNLIAVEDGLRERIRTRRAPTLLTPHPLEAARLLRCATASVQVDRPAAARELAATFNAVVVLKGSGTVIARPDGEIAINTTGNPALATAGSGDVLAGIGGALLAQGWPAWEAALGAVWLHGAAADRLVQQGTGPIGLTASELIPVVRTLINEMVGRRAGVPS
ncbi:NAD(P)H-hydrate dehydratase [Lacisediminimonas profundi]|uniref:NAD(P)H-hydrate dehydratase n=1 Tax=Lacisediminimonas profundi TaxID=2603856 RepID=UPI00124B1F49|nr:NAD(P)H-hydrate dehydratase [Lacisediminimonas profundi]